MTSLLKASLPSDDEADEDYAPQIDPSQPDQLKEEQEKIEVEQDPERVKRIETIWAKLKQNNMPNRSLSSDKPSVKWNQTFQEVDQPQIAASAPPMDSIVEEPPRVEVKPTQEIKEKSRGKRKTSGVDALLEESQKKKKPTTVLDKSKQNWKQFKESNKDEAEELAAHNKSTDQFIEKQQFLSKASEKERSSQLDRKRNR